MNFGDEKSLRFFTSLRMTKVTLPKYYDFSLISVPWFIPR